MGKTKFMVIKLKELIKTVLFAVIGAIIIIMLIIILVPKSADAKYKSGTYTTNITMGDQTAAVSLTFSETKIKDATFIPTSDTLSVFYPLAQTTADEICAQIVDGQSTDGIAPASDYAVTGELIIAAANSCIERASR
ncbi:hypothetical protein SDC9_173957 [bioreactor metagenome]|uniref:FMN-binding domain-containing protein n=1 Tax=bioreactor metagenome TaxID=1076179 RepID=A0A645GKY3_9ZZZZ|nr:hypothetical protein [Candidatus Metalachnospira sp.]